ncbi:hypothetical protein ABIE41_000613 [Bosea sp. OAE506]
MSVSVYGCLLAFAAMLLVWGPFQPYPPIGWVDPQLYINWFLTPAENYLYRGTDYHGARLAVVVPGAILYRLLEPLSAQVAFVGLFYLTAVTAIYRIAGETLSTPSLRLAITAILAGNPLFVAAFARGYVDGPAIALGLLATALIFTGFRGDRRSAFVAAGASAFAAIAAHPFGGGIAGATAAVLILSAPARLPRLVAFAAGAIAMAAALSIGGYALGLPLTFMLSVASDIAMSFQRDGQAFLTPLSSWAPSTPRLVVPPLVAVLIAIGWSTRSRDRPTTTLLLSALVPLALFCATALLSSFVIQHAFYASYIQIALVPAAVFAMSAAERLAPGSRRAIAGFVVAMGAAVMLVGLAIPQSVRTDPFALTVIWLLLGLGLVAIAGLLLAARPVPALTLATCLLGLAGTANGDTASVMKLPGGADFRSQHQLLADLHAVLIQSGVERSNYTVWFGRQDFTPRPTRAANSTWTLSFQNQPYQFNGLDSLAGSLGWSKVWFGPALPQITAETYRLAALLTQARRPLVALCANPSVCEDGLRNLRDIGVAVEINRRLTLSGGKSPDVAVVLAEVLVPSNDSPPMTVILAALREGLLGGPAAGAVTRGELTVARVLTVTCTQTAAPRCDVAYLLSTGEQASTVILFRRQGALWRMVSQ